MTEGFTGTGVALVTPFQINKSIDFKALEKVTNHVIDGGVDFIVVLGTTGESATLSNDEKNEIVAEIIKINNNRVPLIVGMGGNDTMELVKRIQSANFEGISAVLSVAPYYNKPTQQGLYEHFSAVANASPIPVILYNVPGRTASNIDAETVLRLATDHNNIIGVKEASGNFEQIKQIIKDAPAHFQLISGDDAATLKIIREGGSGVISVLANSHPRLFSKLVQTALNNNYDEAEKIHKLLHEYYVVLFEEGSPAGIKTALEQLGLCGREVRLPLVAASEELASKLKNILITLGDKE